MPSKTRKRSFTNYQNSPQLEQTLLNQVLQESIREGSNNILPECQKSTSNNKILTIGFIKSKKAKIFNKFQKLQQQTARQSTQNGNISTIASLKKQFNALQCDQIMSYRHNIKKTEQSQPVEPLLKHQSHSEISTIIRKFDQTKKQAMTDKFRRKFLLFSTIKMKTQVKTERQSIKSQRISTQSQDFQVKRRKANINLNLSFSTKNIKNPKLKNQETFEHQKSKSSMSLTARKFYQRKNKDANIMTQSCYNIFDRERSIKKILIEKKTRKDFSRSVMTL